WRTSMSWGLLRNEAPFYLMPVGPDTRSSRAPTPRLPSRAAEQPSRRHSAALLRDVRCTSVGLQRRQKGRPVALKLAATDAVDQAQFHQRPWLQPAHVLQCAVVEDHVGWHLLLLGQLASAFAQGIIQARIDVAG